MTTLCDRDLKKALHNGQLGISYPEEEEAAGSAIAAATLHTRIQPSTIDLLLGSRFLVPRQRDFSGAAPYWHPVSIARSERRFPDYTTYDQGRFELAPGQFILASTLERVTIGNLHRARVEGKSTLGRLGLLVHCTAGYIDPGFSGNITLELFNIAPYPIVLVAVAPVCQLSVERLSGQPEQLYGAAGLGSHYQGSAGTIGARLTAEPESE